MARGRGQQKRGVSQKLNRDEEKEKEETKVEEEEVEDGKKERIRKRGGRGRGAKGGKKESEGGGEEKEKEKGGSGEGGEGSTSPRIRSPATKRRKVVKRGGSSPLPFFSPVVSSSVQGRGMFQRPWGLLQSLNPNSSDFALVNYPANVQVSSDFPPLTCSTNTLSIPSDSSASLKLDSGKSTKKQDKKKIQVENGDVILFETDDSKATASFAFRLMDVPPIPPPFLDLPLALGGPPIDGMDDSDSDEDFDSDRDDTSKLFRRSSFGPNSSQKGDQRKSSRQSRGGQNDKGKPSSHKGKPIVVSENASIPERGDDDSKEFMKHLPFLLKRAGRKSPFPFFKGGRRSSKSSSSSLDEIANYLRPPPHHEEVKSFFKSYYESRVIAPSRSTISFSNFPFTIPISLQHSLISSTFLHLHATGFPESLPNSLPPSIHLVGPPGSDSLEELIVRALASELDADLMIFDDSGIVGTHVYDMCSECNSPCCFRAPCCYSYPKNKEVAAVKQKTEDMEVEGKQGEENEESKDQKDQKESSKHSTKKSSAVPKYKVGDRVGVPMSTGFLPPEAFPGKQSHEGATIVGIDFSSVSQPMYRVLVDEQLNSGEGGRGFGQDGRLYDEDDEEEDDRERMQEEEEDDDDDDEDQDDDESEMVGGLELSGGALGEARRGGKKGKQDWDQAGETADKKRMRRIKEMVEIYPEGDLQLMQVAEEEALTISALAAFCETAREHSQKDRPVIAYFRDATGAIENPKRKEIVKKYVEEEKKGGRLVWIAGMVKEELMPPSLLEAFGLKARDDEESMRNDVFLNTICIPESSGSFGEGWGKLSVYLEKGKKKSKTEMNLIELKRVMGAVPMRIEIEEGDESDPKESAESTSSSSSSSSSSPSPKDIRQKMVHHLISAQSTCFSHPSFRERDFDQRSFAQICAYSLSRMAMRKAKASGFFSGFGDEKGWKLAGSEENSIEKQDEESLETKKEVKVDERSLRYGINLYCQQNLLKENLLGIKLKKLSLNPHEKKIAKEVVEPGALGVRWESIGALQEAKRLLKEVVLLPLQRPELFRTGCLSKPCKGVLLFGPPGTGKTMLAKAVATACGAHFLNVTSAILFDKYYGEAEKSHRAVFTLASKLAPCVIFIDEIDSILGKRGETEHEASRKCKNEFMSLWDGLTSKEYERVLVLGATNRPFDLDEAVLRRMPRRVMVDLPDLPNRTQILKIHLKDENLSPDLRLETVAEKTDGFSGSDLRQLCVAAAYIRLRDFIKMEEEEKGGATTIEPMKEDGDQEGGASNGSRLTASGEGLVGGLLSESFAENERDDASEILEKEVREPELRPLKLSDFEAAMKDVKGSVSEEGESIQQLRQWDREYGSGAASSSKAMQSYIYM